jgi:hypothetical protein
MSIRDKIADCIYANIDNMVTVDVDPAVDAILAALPDMIPPLDFQHVGQKPPHYDAGMLPTGHYRVRYSGAEESWLVIRGHALIVGRAETPEDGFSLANTHHRAVIAAAFNRE